MLLSLLTTSFAESIFYEVPVECVDTTDLLCWHFFLLPPTSREMLPYGNGDKDAAKQREEFNIYVLITLLFGVYLYIFINILFLLN